MSKKNARLSILSALTLLFMLLNSMALILPAFAADEGLTFASQDRYKTASVYSSSPNTFEATVKFPANMSASTRGGVILGSYDKKSCVSFEIYQNGSPRLYITDAEGTAVLDLKFTSVNVYTGSWVHIALVRDASAGKLHCYINGELKQSLDCSYTSALPTKYAPIVGGDYRVGNSQYFKGELGDLSVFSSVRSASQISADYSGNGDSDGLIARYSFKGLTKKASIEDKSGNGYTLLSSWLDEKEPVTDYAYSFAVIGDTQIVADNYQSEFHKIYDYVIDNIDDKNIKFVFGLGDITNDYADSDDEWELATEHIFRMDGKVPYSLVRGNHDDTASYKEYLPYSHFKSVLGGSYDGTMLNTWQTLTVGEIKYLIMALDLGASDAVLNWASGVVEAHPDYNVIVTTHAYLTTDGSTLGTEDGSNPTKYGAPNTSEAMWQKFIKKHGNIVLVMSGHIPSDKIVKSVQTGDNGNTVTQLLVDPQGVDSARGGVGMVTMLYFSEDGKQVTADCYSTIHEKYFLEENQFSFTLNVVDPDSVGSGTGGTDSGTSEAPETPQEPALPTVPESAGGLTFAKDVMYKTAKAYGESVNTFDAWVYLPKGLDTRGGVILGNYGRSNPAVSFEVYTGGIPRLYVTNSSGSIVIDAKFSSVDLRKDEWIHLAIVRDAVNKKVHCYINGELKQSLDCSYTGNIAVLDPLMLGGDYRSGNAQYFKGAVKSAGVYADARSAQNIGWIYDDTGEGNFEDMLDDDVIALYDISELSDGGEIKDITQNGYHIKLNQVWFEEKAPVTDYAYSFAVVGDTQIVADRYPDDFHKIYDYILENIEEKNIKFVFGLGDITDKDTDAEWQLATENIFRMDGRVPYSLVRGNHDGKTQYNKYLPYSHYKSALSGSYNGDMLNTWQKLTVGKVKYIIMALDYGASDEVLAWAEGIIEDNPEYNVIITTHAYLYRDGTTLDQGDVCPPATTGGYNNGDHIWKKLIKKHENIVMVMSGHDPCDNIIMTKAAGDNGNIVTQMLIDPQGVDAARGGVGLVAMFYISEDGKDVTVEYYSTIKEKYFMTDNQFSFTLDLVDPDDIKKETDATEKETSAPETQKPASAATDAPKKKGCGSAVGVTAAVALTALVLGVCAVKRKREE